jgi:hypothetical protein
MTQEQRKARAHRALGTAFWEQVEREIEVLDVFDLIEFLGADALPIEPSPDFCRDLEERLRADFRQHYCQ